MSSPFEHLTRDLEALGIPNPFPHLKISRAENRWLFGRAYLGNMTVSDMVTVPNGQERYTSYAAGDEATSLTFDPDGRLSRRIRPRNGFTYAIVQSPNYSLFWQRLQASVDLRVDGNAFLTEDSFHDIYGIPAGAVSLPAAVPIELPKPEIS